MKKLIAVVVTAVMMLSLCACSSNATEIRDTMNEFQYACQNLDIDAMLNCIDPDVAQPIQAGIASYSVATGKDSEDVLDEVVDQIFGSEYDPEEFLSTIEATDVKPKVKKNTATIDCTLSFEIGGQTFERDSRFTMTKKNDKWYISDFEFVGD